MEQQDTAIPTFECRPAKIHEVDLDSLFDVLCQACQKRFLGLQFIERRVNKIDAENADGFLLENVGGIAHIDVQQDVVRRATGLQLKAETDPAMRVVRSGKVARGDGINKREEARFRATVFV